ncbi:MAG: hypothetical protein KBB86_02390 [Candidatus Pacebacteria bacterium]|nr:hypothetical protein [Candidatus Paceibacterota bacterium]
MKTFIFIIIALGIVFFFVPIFRSVSGCGGDPEATPETCSFKKETGFQHFFYKTMPGYQ